MPTDTHHTPADRDASAAAPFGMLEGTHWIESLNDGVPVLIRPLREDDRAREEAFIGRLSPQSRRHRFMDTFKEASPALVDQLMQVDHQQQEAFIALAHDNGELREVGISRYSATGKDKQCECAVTVADDWQKRGLGVLLMRHLIDQARKNGYRQLISLDAADNEPMHELASYLGFHCKRDPEDATQVVHTLDL
ncbi:GNAT family N-acetyltransferase [Rhodanobacter ginsengisoli]|uniref:GNAT family N-acetyltransferase n=1 Tax=Rhodanobacter ginsengisoli TaxID=418646 RepID=A0ABW0QKV3_9GAMM